MASEKTKVMYLISKYGWELLPHDGKSRMFGPIYDEPTGVVFGVLHDNERVQEDASDLIETFDSDFEGTEFLEYAEATSGFED